MAVADFSRINSNIGALNALNSLQNVNKNLGMHQMRLATGRRINSAADDPAGMTIATTFRKRNEGLKTAMGNIGDAKNLMSVAEGGLNKVQDILLEMRNKAEQAASDTLGDSERSAIQSQLKEYTKEINDIVEQTTWNGKKLLDGLGESTDTDPTSFKGTINFQTGAEAGEKTTLTGAEFGGVDAGDLLIGRTSDAGIIDSSSITHSSGTSLTFSATEITVGSSVTADYGNYSIQIVGASTGGTSTTVKLLDADGASAATSITVDLSGTAGTANFSNGITIDLTTSELGDVSTGSTIDFDFELAEAGSYSGDVTDSAGAETAMTNLDSAIKTVSERLQTLGALGSRLNFKEEALAEAQVNTEAAFNRIANADMAMSQLEATKYQILQQTATSMLAQANQAPQGLLSLFR